MEDPIGYIVLWIIGAIVGGIAGAVYSYKKTGSVGWIYVAGGAVSGALVEVILLQQHILQLQLQ